MKDYISNLIQQLKNLVSQTRSELLYTVAYKSLGTDASPSDIALDEYGCAETINKIHQKAFGDQIGGDVSTTRMFKCLMTRIDFQKVVSPRRGDIIISPTGHGWSPQIKNGHVGIISDKGRVMSNSSSNGLFLENYTIDSWRNRYQKQGGYPVYFFRKL